MIGRPSVRASMPTISSIRIYLYRVQTSNANDYRTALETPLRNPGCHERASAYHENLSRESSFSNHSILHHTSQLAQLFVYYPEIASTRRDNYIGTSWCNCRWREIEKKLNFTFYYMIKLRHLIFEYFIKRYTRLTIFSEFSRHSVIFFWFSALKALLKISFHFTQRLAIIQNTILSYDIIIITVRDYSRISTTLSAIKPLLTAFSFSSYICNR